MFDSKNFGNLQVEFEGLPIGFAFYDRFSKKFGPLNASASINEAVYTACNYLKSVEEKNISLEHIDVYVLGTVKVENAIYNLGKPRLLFNAVDYKEVYNHVLSEV